MSDDTRYRTVLVGTSQTGHCPQSKAHGLGWSDRASAVSAAAGANERAEALGVTARYAAEEIAPIQ